jgi:PTH2 family peptidyl-tRNA hydrolase
MKNTMYIVVNKDLSMSTGKVAAQVGHACTEYLMDVLTGQNEAEKRKCQLWYNDCQKKIILKACSKAMSHLASENGAYPVYDLGLTEIEPDSLTAICLGIFDQENLPKTIKRLQCY